MRSTPLFIVLLAATGCMQSKQPPAAPVWQRDIIDVGQPRADAKAVAEHAGYSVYESDPIQVEWLPQPTGFVIELDEDFDLYVIKDKAARTVKGLTLVSHPRKPKSLRAHLSFRSFALPSAPAGGG
jgi:hypothetical protein